MTTTGCFSCDQEAEFDRLPPREAVAYDRHWRVVHAFDSALRGWLVLVPRRHVMDLAELTDPESASLGVWQVRLARALAEELQQPKTYVAEFGEAAGYHLHFHIVSRPVDLDRELRGPDCFGLLGRGEDEWISAVERDDLAKRLSARLMPFG